MAADSDGPGESLTTIVTCEGDLGDPDFPAKFEQILNRLRKLVCEDDTSDKLCVCKLEPWNSVRVTLAIPREAALRLRQLASEGSQQLRALGILSVQVEGDQVISLRLAGMFGQEPQEIVLRTGSEDASNVPVQSSVPEGTAGLSGLTRILTASTNTTSTSSINQPSTSAEASTSSDKVQFKSPNVVCPTDTQLPKPPPQATQTSSPAVGPSQRNYNGPFPFASMTHAAQAIHSRENQTQLVSERLSTTASSSSSVGNNHPFNQPPPPYPSQPSVVKTAIANSPNVAMSSPLLVNLLQNDGAQIQNKMLPASVEQRKTIVKPAVVRVDEQLVTPEASNNLSDIIPSSNSAFVQTGAPSSTELKVPVTSAIKYPSQTNNVPMPHLNSNQNLANVAPSQIRNVRLAQPLVHQKVNMQQVQTRPPFVQQTTEQLQTSVVAQNCQIRQVRPTQKFPNTVPANIHFNNQFNRANFRGHLTQLGVQPVNQHTTQPNVQQFSSPPPYPRQRGTYPELRFQQQSQPQPQQAQRPQGSWQFNSVDSNMAPIGQPMPNLAGLSQNMQNLQPIAQPMPHLASLNPLLENSLSNITPSLTDLSKTDLDAILPSLEPDVPETTTDMQDVPELLTSTGKRRQFLINPLTGELEPMPSESSSSESENEDGKETSDIFNDFNSPLNERSNSIYSDDDTCSTTISRKFDTTDQSDSEATVRSTNSENSVKSHQRVKSGKNRDRNRDSPSLKKNKDSQPEKIKLRLKLEKSEPVSPAYKVDVSFINTQQPKRAIQNITKSSVAVAGIVPCTAGEELRVPPLHISLRGRNSVVINSEKKKKHPKLNADGSIMEMKRSKKSTDSLKVKKSLSAKDISIKSGSLLTTMSKSDSSLNQKTNTLIKSDVTLPGTSASTVELQKHTADVKNELKSDVKSPVKLHSDVDDLPLNYRLREPGEILPSKHQKFLSDLKKSKKSTKLNHIDLYREQNLLSGGHMVDDFKTHRKLKDEKLIKNTHKTLEGKINSHLKKDKLSKDRLIVGHVGEIRRGSDSDVVKGLKRHADSNGLLHIEKKRRLSQSDGKTVSSAITESQGVIKSVKLKSSSPERHQPAGLTQPIVGSTNIGTVGLSSKNVFKTASKLQKPITKVRRDKTVLTKTKEGSTKTKDLNRDKTYSQNVAEKLAKQLPLPIGEIDMEAKFKQSLLESDIPRRHLERKFESNKSSCEVQNQQRVVELVHTLTERDQQGLREQDRLKSTTSDERQCTVDRDIVRIDKKLDENKTSESELRQSQRLDEKQSGRSPNSGGQGEDSGIESMDALSEKSPNQASQSPHCHTDTLSLTEATSISEMKTVKSEKLESCLPDIMDIEAQLAKLDGLPTLNGDLSHIIKTEPFMKTETLIEKLEGTESKDLNENKERVKETLLEECCNSNSEVKKEIKVDISEIQLSAAMQDSFKQGNITVTRCGESTEKTLKNQADVEISLVNRNYNCVEEKEHSKEEERKNENNDGKDLDFDPLPIRRKPPLYTYSNPEKQSRDSDSPVPNLSDIEYDNSDSNSECSDPKSKGGQKCSTVTRRRKQNLDNIPMNDNELEACMEALNSDKYMNDLTNFKKSDLGKKAPKSLLEQLLIEIPTEVSEKQVSSISPSISEKSLNACKSTIRTRSSSKLNSPDISDSKSDKTTKTPKHSPVAVKPDTSPTNSPVMCPKTSPKSIKTIVPAKRKRQESESSTQSNVSNEEQHLNNTRNKKARKCSENAVELIKACMGLDNTENKNVVKTVKEVKKLEKTKLNTGLLRKTQLNEVESSDSDEPLIEIAGKVRNKHATRNKINSTKTSIASSFSKITVSLVGKTNVSDEKIGTRRSVRNNSGVSPAPLKTRSKLVIPGEKTSLATTTGITSTTGDDANTRRKTRSAVSDDVKRRRNSRDSK